jgi:HK97 family phage major capsid protein
MSKLVELRGKLDERREQLATIFEEAGPDNDMSKVKSIEGDSAAKVEKIRALNAEMGDLHKEVVAEQELESIKSSVTGLSEVDRPSIHGNGDRPADGPKASIGELFVKSKAFTGYQAGSQGGPVASFDIDMRSTLFQTSAGWAPESLRTGIVTYFPTRPAPQVIDAFPEYETKQAVVKYMEETTFTNAAAETAEAGAYNAATLVLTERSQTVRKVTVWLPVTDEQLEDETEARSYIDNRLTFMLRQRVDSQALVGDGNAPNVLGTENVSGIQTQALGTDPIFDAAFKLFRKIRDNGFAEPNAFFIAPSKWETVALTRTADGLYILGNPASDIPTRLWGVPGIQTVAGTATKLTAGDYANFAGLYVRRGVDVQVGYNNDDFTKGQLSIRADVRIAVVHFRPKAFGTVTGL